MHFLTVLKKTMLNDFGTCAIDQTEPQNIKDAYFNKQKYKNAIINIHMYCKSLVSFTGRQYAVRVIQDFIKHKNFCNLSA